MPAGTITIIAALLFAPLAHAMETPQDFMARLSAKYRDMDHWPRGTSPLLGILRARALASGRLCQRQGRGGARLRSFFSMPGHAAEPPGPVDKGDGSVLLKAWRLYADEHVKLGLFNCSINGARTYRLTHAGVGRAIAERLMKDPKGTIMKDFGVELRDEVKVCIHEDTADVINIVLPAPLAVENAPPGKRAWYGMFPQLGAPVGFLVSGAVFLLLSASLTDRMYSRLSASSVAWSVAMVSTS